MVTLYTRGIKSEKGTFWKYSQEKIVFLWSLNPLKKSRLVSDMTQGKIEGKKGRGTPKISYIDNIKQWTGKWMSDAIHAGGRL